MEKIDYVERMRYSSDTELWYYDEIELESYSSIMEEAYEEHGERFARQLAKVPDSHFPKRYGKDELRVDWGYDYLGSFWKEPMRIRKDGKAHRQDIKSRKSYLIHTRGFELEGHCECGCRFTKKSQKLRKNSYYYEYPEKDLRK